MRRRLPVGRGQLPTHRAGVTPTAKAWLGPCTAALLSWKPRGGCWFCYGPILEMGTLRPGRSGLPGPGPAGSGGGAAAPGGLCGLERRPLVAQGTGCGLGLLTVAHELSRGLLGSELTGTRPGQSHPRRGRAPPCPASVSTPRAHAARQPRRHPARPSAGGADGGPGMGQGPWESPSGVAQWGAPLPQAALPPSPRRGARVRACECIFTVTCSCVCVGLVR